MYMDWDNQPAPGRLVMDSKMGSCSLDTHPAAEEEMCWGRRRSAWPASLPDRPGLVKGSRWYVFDSAQAVYVEFYVRDLMFWVAWLLSCLESYSFPLRHVDSLLGDDPLRHLMAGVSTPW